MRDRLPSRDSIPDADRLFYDDYREAHRQNFETLCLSSGQTMFLLHAKKDPSREIDTSGSLGNRDEMGARRLSQPEVVTSPQQTTGLSRAEIHQMWKRRTDGLYQSHGIPVLVESSRLAKIVTASGKDFDGDWIVHVPTLFLERNGLVINPAQDRVSYQSVSYRFSQVQDYGYIIDASAELILGLKKDTVN